MKSRRVHILLLVQLMLVGVAVAGGLFLSSDPDSLNTPKKMGQKKHYWVCRRFNDPADKDDVGNLALAIHIYKEASQIKAMIWQYNSATASAYVPKANAPLVCDCVVQKPGDAANIKLEKIEFKQAGTSTIVGWGTRAMGGKGQGSASHKARHHARFVFRYNSTFFRTAAKANEIVKLPHETPCDDPPNDDVLEEEAIVEPTIPNDPPPLDYAP